jgi:hypothetical protein
MVETEQIAHSEHTLLPFSANPSNCLPGFNQLVSGQGNVTMRTVPESGDN